jgi:hypothetical protein
MLLVLTAIVGPFGFAFVFMIALNTGDISAEQWRLDPNAGYKQATHDMVLLVTYGFAQPVFLIGVPWRMTRRPWLRAIFVAIALPLCLIVSFVTVLSRVAG